jgi:hypothetical protein
MGKRIKMQGVLLLEVELLKATSHQKKVGVEVAWPDMLSLPLRGDTMQLDRAKVDIGLGPADDDTILDHPQTLANYTWQASYGGEEWISAQAFATLVQRSPNVISARIIQ